MDNKLKNTIISLSKISIQDALNGTKSIDRTQILEEYPLLNENRATFVTLTIDGTLRGCIGTLVAHDKFFDDLVLNSRKAAFEDPRFPPLSRDEFEKVDIEVSILSPQVEIKYENLSDLKSKIDIGNDGVFIRQGDKRATFLPQVWKQLPDFNDFLTHLFAKAGIIQIDDPIDVFVYRVEEIS